jgi:hypothetical protein
MKKHRNLRTTVRWLLVPAFMAGICLHSPACRASNDPCDGITPPESLSARLKESFPHWRIERTSDLETSYQDLWAKKFPTACPGFVAGHLLKPDTIAYALLLVPSDQTKKGYRLVVFSESTTGTWHPAVLEKDDQYTPTSAVIRVVPPGEYREADGVKKIHTRTDGIVSERIEAGILVYYWNGARFRSVATSV